jgi:hypothetical protein
VWFGLLAAPLAWIVQGLIGWWIGASICAAWSIEFARTMLAVVGVLALTVALAGLTSSLVRWRHARATSVSPLDQPREFFLFGGVFVSGAFAIGILWATLNALFINVCGVTR